MRNIETCLKTIKDTISQNVYHLPQINHLPTYYILDKCSLIQYMFLYYHRSIICNIRKRKCKDLKTEQIRINILFLIVTGYLMLCLN